MLILKYEQIYFMQIGFLIFNSETNIETCFFYMNISLQLKIKMNKKIHSPGI